MTRPNTPIGQQRARLRLLMPVETETDQGGAALTWQPGAALWGRIEALSGAQIVEGEQIDSRVSTRITTRWRPDVTPSQRVSEGGRVFAILAALDPDGTKRQLVCLCEELAP